LKKREKEEGGGGHSDDAIFLKGNPGVCFEYFANERLHWKRAVNSFLMHCLYSFLQSFSYLRS
jgi:hypothetical protein